MTLEKPQGIQLDVNPERATISIDCAALQAGVVINADVICRLLGDAKVTTGIDKGAIKGMLEDIAQGKSVEKRVVAKAVPPMHGSESSIDFFVSEGDIVAPNEVIAVQTLGGAGQPGTTVTGDAIAVSELELKPIEAGNNTVLDESGELRATLCGVVAKQGTKISVEPELFITPDNLRASMNIHAMSTLGTPITAEHITDALTVSGVTHGIDEDAILAALEEAEQNQAVVADVVVAAGSDPVAAQPAKLKYFFTINGEDPDQYLASMSAGDNQKKAEKSETQNNSEAINLVALDMVKEGGVIAKLEAAKEGADGCDVFGKAIKRVAERSESRPILPPGENVEINQTTGQYSANVLLYGFPAIRNNKIIVIDPVELSQDQMSATLTLYANKTSDEYPITRALVLEKLNHLGVNYGIDEAAIDSAISQIQETQKPLIKRPIATGKDGEAGSDAYLDYILNMEKKVGSAKDDGTIDYKERGTIVNVEGNQPICTKVEATMGQPSVTITGESQPSEPGKDIQFKAGEHCYFKDNIFYATEAGAVFIKDNVVHVTEVFHLKGDVDLQSGNLFQKKGCIDVGGSVQSGFEVKANGHIIVRNNIENARLIAGGDVNIGGGIVQPEGGDGYIHAVGNVTVKFSQNAQIFSYADIIIEHSCMSSRLHAKGAISADKGKGNIIGGVAKAGKYIRAKSIGSPAAAVTVVEIELDPKFRKDFIEKSKQLEEMAASNPAAKEELAALTKRYRDMYEETRLNAAIIVEDTIYPGVKVKILDGVRKITEELRRCKITLGTNNVIQIKALEEK